MEPLFKIIYNAMYLQCSEIMYIGKFTHGLLKQITVLK